MPCSHPAWGSPILRHHIRQHQRGQRVELAETESLAGIEGLEEDGTETVVGIGLAIHLLAAEALVPDVLAAGPQPVAVGELGAFFKLRALDELIDAFAIIGEAEAFAGIGGGLDVIGLQPVIGIDVIGMLADDGADDVDRIDAIGRSRGLDLAHQRLVGREQLDDLVILVVECGADGAGATDGGTGDGRLFGIAIAGRHDGNTGRIGRHGGRRRHKGGRDEQCQQQSFQDFRTPALRDFTFQTAQSKAILAELWMNLCSNP